MTHLQKIIRESVKADGYMHIRVGRSSPCTMNTIKCLRRDGYRCVKTGQQDAGC